MRKRFRLSIVLGLMALVAWFAWTLPERQAPVAKLALFALASPTSEIILRVQGVIAVKNAGDTAAFDFALLSRLPKKTIQTTTVWTDGVQEFTGIELDDFLDGLGATGRRIDMIALNDYKVTLDREEARDGGPILAFLQNGKPIGIENRGPIWLMYPFDDVESYRNETIYAKSIWQLSDILIHEE